MCVLFEAVCLGVLEMVPLGGNVVVPPLLLNPGQEEQTPY